MEEPRRITFGGLDLDDVGTPVRHDATCCWTGDPDTEFYNPNTAERAACCLLSRHRSTVVLLRRRFRFGGMRGVARCGASIVTASYRHNDGFQRLVGGDAELARCQGKSVSCLFDLFAALGDVVGDRGSGGDAGTSSARCFGDPCVDELAIGTGDGVWSRRRARRPTVGSPADGLQA